MKEITVKYLKESRTAYTSLYMNLIQMEPQLLNENKKNIFFLEGQDDIKYYNFRFKTHFSEFHFFDSGGKKNVIKAYEYINSKYNGKLKIKFFIDKDFDELHTKNNLFVTPCYSIENLYVSNVVFEEILKCEFNLNKYSEEDRKDFKKLCELYSERQKEFLCHIDDLMFWFFLHSSKKECDLSKLKDRLFSKTDPLIRISLNKVTKNYDFDTLKRYTENPLDFTEEDIKNYTNLVSKKSKIYFYRGKYILEFFEKFMRILLQEINKENSTILTKKRKINLQFSDNTLSLFSQYSITPNCLEYFLKIN